MLVQKKQEWLYEENLATNTYSGNILREEQIKEQETKQKVRLNKSLRSKCLTLLATTAVLAAIVVLQSSYIVNSGYVLVDKKQQIIQTERANELLKLDIAQASSHERISQIAVSSLGMTVPQNVFIPSETNMNNGLLHPQKNI
ncbi:cell division protein FtsL [Selenomonadales bacterium OttesenSCG-928-I06]|nr:cell division protein FtsL [Selenomonadales bacterium OttesenSCG-928-I06]